METNKKTKINALYGFAANKQKLKRAIGYALSLISFQEVGMGPDENLQIVREIVFDIRKLCEKETGIILEGYPTQFLKDNKKLLKEEKLPYTLIKIFKEGKE